MKRPRCPGSGEEGKKPDLILEFCFPLQPQGQVLGRGRRYRRGEEAADGLPFDIEKLGVPWATAECLLKDHIQKLLLKACWCAMPVTSLVKRKLPSTFRVWRVLFLVDYRGIILLPFHRWQWRACMSSP